jgi:hypothetical protein
MAAPPKASYQDAEWAKEKAAAGPPVVGRAPSAGAPLAEAPAPVVVEVGTEALPEAKQNSLESSPPQPKSSCFTKCMECVLPPEPRKKMAPEEVRTTAATPSGTVR